MHLDRLTKRHEELLRDFCAGLSPEEVGARRGIAASTAYAYRTAILLRVLAPRGATIADVCRALAERDRRAAEPEPR